MPNLLKKITEKEMNRRDFLKTSAVGAAMLAFLDTGGNALAPTAEAASVDAVVNGEGKWIPAACWHNCGGHCVNKALVVDGVVIRQKTDDTHPDTPDYPQQRSCPRGRSQRQQCFGADRLKYPMKRKHWEPLTGGDKSLRGRDEWERISWDEALDYVAAELKHARETYGDRSILHPTTHMQPNCWVLPFLNYCGGFTSVWSTGSTGTFRFHPELYYGYGTYLGNDRFDVRKAETVILYGSNPAWSAGGNPSYNLMQAKRAGAKFVSVGPFYDTSASVYNAEWIPVRVGTDISFLLAVAYTMITEDDKVANPIIDWDFLERCTVGFDASHMPDDAKINENFKDYVLGKYDGIPKTPEWATDICGTPVEKIVWFARLLCKNNRITFLHSFAPARQKGAESFPQLIMTIGAMGGHFGKEGHSFSTGYSTSCGNEGTPLVSHSYNTGLPYLTNGVDDCICTAQMWDAIIDGKYNLSTGGAFPNYSFFAGEMREIDIRIIYHEKGAYLQNFENIHRGIEAHRKVDFVVTHSQFYRAEAQYADIVLPVTTDWERVGDFGYFGQSNREVKISHFQITEPLYETKTDQWICEQLVTRLGLDPKGVFPVDQKQQYFNALAGSVAMKEDGLTYEPMLTITDADIARWGVEGTPQEGRVTLDEYEKDGFYQVERHQGDNYSFVGLKSYRDDPENNPRKSKSGKMEIYSDTYADLINSLNYNPDDRIKPYPAYRVTLDNYENTFENNDIKSGVKSKYPYQLFTPHYLRRAHAALDNLPWLREAHTNSVYLNSEDASNKEIKDGDTVVLFNDYGKVLRNAIVTERLVPGIVCQPHGGWLDLDENTGIDSGGAENCLTRGYTTVSGVSGFNSCLLDFEKYDGPELISDCLKPQRIINL